jgi:hypothetical protein
LNRFGLGEPTPSKSAVEGRCGEESIDVGDLAKVRGGEEERRTTVVGIVDRARRGHGETVRNANAKEDVGAQSLQEHGVKQAEMGWDLDSEDACNASTKVGIEIASDVISDQTQATKTRDKGYES